MNIRIYSERVYSTPEVAIILNIPKSKVRAWVKSGKLRPCHTVSNQGAYGFKGYNITPLLKGDPRYVPWPNEGVEIPDELKQEYLLASKEKCMREISAVNIALRTYMTELDEILKQLFEEES